MTYKYIVKDSFNKYIKEFSTYKDATTFKMIMGRMDWSIKTIKL